MLLSTQHKRVSKNRISITCDVETNVEVEPETTALPGMTIANLPDSDVVDDQTQASASADEESSQSELSSEKRVITNLDDLFWSVLTH